jgi:hypothetical protein
MNSKNKANDNKALPMAGEVIDGEWSTLATDVSLFYSPGGPEGQPIAFQGIVLERRERQPDAVGKVASYFIVQATRPFMVKNADKRWVTANVGDHVWVDDRAMYARMHDLLPRHTPAGTYVFEVLVKPTKKVSIRGGKTMWQGEPLRFKALDPSKHGFGGLAALAAPTAAAQLPEAIAEDE